VRYFKPDSVTWWSGFIPVMAGTFVAFEPVHGLIEWADAVSATYGNTSPVIPINAGLALIGIRGAQDDR
jgi:hypothetical protein